MTVGEYIRNERNKIGHSLMGLGRKIGMRDSNLCEIETGKRKTPRPEILRKIANGLEDYGKTADEHYLTMMEIAGYLGKEDVISTVGEYIKRERKHKNLTLRGLAKRSDSSDSYLSQVENNKRSSPKPEMLKRIAIGLSEDEHERKMHYSALMELAGYESEKREYSSTDLSHISTADLLAEIKRRIK